MHRQQINTDVAVVEIVTPEETPIDYAFDFAVSDITANSATVTVTPHDVRAFYYWNVMTEAEYEELGRDEAKIAVWFEQMMDEKRIEQFGEYADMFVPLADYIYSQCSKDGNPETYTFGKLSSSTTYYPYAFWVDEITGKIVSSTSFAEKPFTTPERVVSSAEAAPAAWITDGDDWARLDATKYGSYAGKAVLGARLTPNGDAVHWYSNIYNAADAESLSDEEWTNELTVKQYNKDKKTYNVLSPVEWGGEYVILSVAVDAAGNAGPVWQASFSLPRKRVPNRSNPFRANDSTAAKKKPTAFCCRFFLCRREERSTVPPVRIRRRTTSSPRGSPRTSCRKRLFCRKRRHSISCRSRPSCSSSPCRRSLAALRVAGLGLHADFGEALDETFGVVLRCVVDDGHLLAGNVDLDILHSLLEGNVVHDALGAVFAIDVGLEYRRYGRCLFRILRCGRAGAQPNAAMRPMARTKSFSYSFRVGFNC